MNLVTLNSKKLKSLLFQLIKNASTSSSSDEDINGVNTDVVVVTNKKIIADENSDVSCFFLGKQEEKWKSCYRYQYHQIKQHMGRKILDPN